jgi:hypothetical protein
MLLVQSRASSSELGQAADLVLDGRKVQSAGGFFLEVGRLSPENVAGSIFAQSSWYSCLESDVAPSLPRIHDL